MNLLAPLTNFTSQSHSACRNKHHFRGDYISPCADGTIKNTLTCAHKRHLDGPLQIEDLLERLCNFRIIDETQRVKLIQFTNRMLSHSLETDVAVTTASMHLRGTGKTTSYCLSLLGLKSSAELEAMTLNELEELAGKRQIEINRGLVALKFTIHNVANDIRNGDINSAKDRMQKFIAHWNC